MENILNNISYNINNVESIQHNVFGTSVLSQLTPVNNDDQENLVCNLNKSQLCTPCRPRNQASSQVSLSLIKIKKG